MLNISTNYAKIIPENSLKATYIIKEILLGLARLGQIMPMLG